MIALLFFISNGFEWRQYKISWHCLLAVCSFAHLVVQDCTKGLSCLKDKTLIEKLSYSIIFHYIYRNSLFMFILLSSIIVITTTSPRYNEENNRYFKQKKEILILVLKLPTVRNLLDFFNLDPENSIFFLS